MPSKCVRRSTSSPSSSSSLLFILFLLFLLSLSFLPSPCLSQKSRTIRLGFLGATNLPNANTQAGTGPALFATRLAIRHINAQTEILPNTQLELIHNNTNSDPGTGNFMAYDQIQNRGVVGLIGEYNSGVSVAVAYPSRFYRIPMVSYGSTSPDFTTFHDSQFPYFLRLTPSQNQESVLLAYLISSFGWKRVGVVHTTDSPGAAGAQAFTSVANSLGIKVVLAVSFPPSSSLEDVYAAMSVVKASGATILLFIGAINDMQTLIHTCTLGGNSPDRPPLGLYGPGYAWLGMHSYIYTSIYTNASGGIVPHLYEFAQGMIGLQNFADVNSSIYKTYHEDWLTTPLQPDLPSVVPTDPASMTAPANFAYDSVIMYAHALHRMETEYGITDMKDASPSVRALFLDVLKNVTFSGVSGSVSVDKNGDRFAPFDIMNFEGPNLKTIGRVNSNGEVLLDTMNQIYFMGGYKALDYVVRGRYSISESIQVGMTVMTAICMMIVLLFVIIVFLLRDRPLMKAASPPFILSMLLGVLLLLSSLYPRIFENVSSRQPNNDKSSIAICEAELMLSNIGYTLIVGSLLVKTYRVDAIFRMRQFQQRIFTNFDLFCWLLGLLICQIGLCLGLIFGNRFEIKLSYYDSQNDYVYCSTPNESLSTGVTMSWRFFLLLVTAIYTFRIRSIPDAFNESKTISAVVYNLTFLSILLPIIDEAMGRGKGVAVIAYGASVFVISVATSGIMLLPKFYQFLRLMRGTPIEESTEFTSGVGPAAGAGGMGLVASPKVVGRRDGSGSMITGMTTTAGLQKFSQPPHNYLKHTTTPTTPQQSYPKNVTPVTTRRSVTGTNQHPMSERVQPTLTRHVHTGRVPHGVVPTGGTLSAPERVSGPKIVIPPPVAPVASAPSSIPGSPRMHLDRGVSLHLRQMIVQQLMATPPIGVAQEYPIQQHQQHQQQQQQHQPQKDQPKDHPPQPEQPQHSHSRSHNHAYPFIPGSDMLMLLPMMPPASLSLPPHSHSMSTGGSFDVDSSPTVTAVNDTPDNITHQQQQPSHESHQTSDSSHTPTTTNPTMTHVGPVRIRLHERHDIP